MPDRGTAPASAQVILAVILAVALPAAGPAARSQDPPAAQAGDLATEEGLRKALDLLEGRYEAAARQVGLALWARWAEPDARDDAREEQAWDALAAVYADPLLQEVLTRWAYRTGLTRDPSLSRRVRLWHTTSQSAVWTLDPGVRRLTRELSRRLAGQSFTLEGRPATRAELIEVLRASPDRARRRQAWKELLRGAGDLRADVIRLIRLRAVKATETRSAQVPRLIFAAEQLDPTWILQIVNILGGRTQAAHDRLLAGIRETLGVERVEPWDLDHGLEARSAARWKGAARVDPFSPGQAATLSRRVLEHAGLAGTEEPAARRLPVPMLFLPTALPAEPRVLLDGSAGAVDLLAAAAPRLMAAHAGQSAPMLKGYPWLPTARSTLADEGMRHTLAALLHDELFVREALQISAADTKLLMEDLRERSLLAFRRALVDEAFEHAVTVNPDADLEARYRDLFGKGIGMPLGPDDPVDWPLRLPYVDAPMTSLGRLFGPAIAAEALAKMSAQLGDARARPGAAGAWLIEHCLSGGERLASAERLAPCTERGHDTKLYFEWLGAGRR